MILAAITTHKRKPAMVERALKSVIAQTFTDWNLVVVDDSPSDYEFRDDVRKMVESYAAQDDRILYVAHDKNYGANHARNTALKIAENTYGGGGMNLFHILMTTMNGFRRNLRNNLRSFKNVMKIPDLLHAVLYFLMIKL